EARLVQHSRGQPDVLDLFGIEGFGEAIRRRSPKEKRPAHEERRRQEKSEANSKRPRPGSAHAAPTVTGLPDARLSMTARVASDTFSRTGQPMGGGPPADSDWTQAEISAACPLSTDRDLRARERLPDQSVRMR